MSERHPSHSHYSLVVLRISDAQVSGDDLADALRDELLAMLDSTAAANVIIDMSSVTYLSSAGIRPLFALNKALRTREGRLILAGLLPAVESVFTLAHLISTGDRSPATFEHQPDVPAAVASLYGVARP
jgi:anti-anti-sigma factor